jgi:integrin beta 3
MFDGAHEFDEMADAEAAPTGFIAKLRHGWVGPVLVASVVSLVAVLVFVMLSRGGGGGGAAPSSSPTPSTTPRQPNPEAAAGTAMADGTYRCWVRTEQANAAATMEFIGYLLEVPRGPGQYVWDGQPGTYEIVRSSLSKDSDVWGDVTFTSGPLQNVKAQSIATFPDASGIVSEVVVLFKDGSGRNCLVAI